MIIYILVYVDDKLLTGNNPSFIHSIVSALDTKFGLKIFGSVHYFLGISVVHTSYGLQLNQAKYAQEVLFKFGMKDCNLCATPMVLGSKLHFEDGLLFEQPSLYRSLIGALQYLTITRPDLSFAVADILTKPFFGPQFQTLRDHLHVFSSSSVLQLRDKLHHLRKL
ncbi:uncharacterized protein LOC116131765 [Pistacia vera]|uniref:uncharacterized protein LOC116131765 n=1 Tax=Pistacia vera TaxID=55513 RepID=UPI0012633CED|nr:uncharacterized protein LOC116131765 [Pistacia vera]